MKLHFDKKWSSCLRVKLWHFNDEHCHIWHVSPFSMRKKEIVATGKIFHAHVSYFCAPGQDSETVKEFEYFHGCFKLKRKRCTSVFIYDFITLSCNWYHILCIQGLCSSQIHVNPCNFTFSEHSPKYEHVQSMEIYMTGHQGPYSHKIMMSYCFIPWSS